MTSIILHNMIVEDERDSSNSDYLAGEQFVPNHVRSTTDTQPYSQHITHSYVERYHHVRDSKLHYRLKRDLVEH